MLGNNMGLYKNIDPDILKDEKNKLEETKHNKAKRFYKFFGAEYKGQVQTLPTHINISALNQKNIYETEETENENCENDNPEIYGEIFPDNNDFGDYGGRDYTSNHTSKDNLNNLRSNSSNKKTAN